MGIKPKAYDTGSSQAVPHPSTIPARRCLTSVIGRERVFSSWYGRRQHSEFFLRSQSESEKMKTIINRKYDSCRVRTLIGEKIIKNISRTQKRLVNVFLPSMNVLAQLVRELHSQQMNHK